MAELQLPLEQLLPPLIEPPAKLPPALPTVDVNIPPFWLADPQLWFTQMEAQFNTRNVTNECTKLDYVVASLAPEFSVEVRDLILALPTANAYSTVKDQLINARPLLSSASYNGFLMLKSSVTGNQRSCSIECNNLAMQLASTWTTPFYGSYSCSASLAMYIWSWHCQGR